MIPYFAWREIPIGGGMTLAVFGVLVALGVVAGVLFAHARARTLGIPEHVINSGMAWALISGFLGSHLVVLLTEPLPTGGGVLGLFEFWNGMSAFGGFFGAFAGLAAYYARRRSTWLLEADVLVQALVVGWVFGRLGCTLVHDHVGKPSSFFLAVRFPDAPRHDLGLYEFLYTVAVLVPAIAILNRRPRAPGASVEVIALLYAPARFLADFLRNTDLPGADARYLGLTPAQYGCIALAAIAVGLGWVRRGSLQPATATAPPRRSVPSRPER